MEPPLPLPSLTSAALAPVAEQGCSCCAMRCCRCGCRPCRLIWCVPSDLCRAEKSAQCFSGCGCCPPRIICCGTEGNGAFDEGVACVQCEPCQVACCQEPGSDTPTCRMGLHREPLRLGCRWSNSWCLCLTCPCLAGCSACLVGDRPENCFCTCKDCAKDCALLTVPVWTPICATVQACYIAARAACCPGALPCCLRGHEKTCDQACASMWLDRDSRASCCPCPCLDARDDMTLYGRPYIFCCCAHHACLLEESGRGVESGCL